MLDTPFLSGAPLLKKNPGSAPATVSISDNANVCPALKQLCALLNQDVNFVEISSSRGDAHIKRTGGVSKGS